MFKKLIAAIVAMALVLPGAAQAQGMSKNDKAVLGTIAGIAALAVIANQIKKKDEKKAKKAEPPPHVFGRDHGKDHGPDWGQGKGKPGHDFGRDKHKMVLDARCVSRVKDRRGDWQEMLGRDCLRSTNADLRRLPDRCEMSIKTKRNTEHGYSASCLKSQGYRIARR